MLLQTTRSRSLRLLLLCLACSLSGCQVTRALNVRSAGAFAEPPGNLAAYVYVEDRKHGVGGLEASSFRIYENGQPLDLTETRQVLLDRERVAAHHTVLLVDGTLSTQAPSLRAPLERAARAFVARVGESQPVTLLIFDGQRDLVEAGTLGRGAAALPAELPALGKFVARDASRNLYGAVVAALGVLDAKLAETHKDVAIGTLVLFTAGPDRAKLATFEQARASVEQSPHSVIAIGVDEPTTSEDLEALGKTYVAPLPRLDAAALEGAFAAAATEADGYLQGHYLLSYCSPARAGAVTVTIEAVAVGEGGPGKGSFEGRMNATGFGPDCDPSRFHLWEAAPPGPASNATPPTTTPTPAPPSTAPAPGAPATPPGPPTTHLAPPQPAR